MHNPLLDKWETPYETPPFDLIEVKHFKQAVKAAINSATGEITEISDNPESPDFENTVAALERTGDKLARIASVLFNLNNAETSGELQAAAQEISPLLTRFSNTITMNEKLFSRLKTVYDSRESLSLSTEQSMLLELKYRNFILGGSGLEESGKKRFKRISEELSKLNLKFEENVLGETNAFELHLENPSDLSGLPEGIREMAAAEAVKRKKSGWVFTLHFPSYIPFMQYADNRKLREVMYKALTSRSFKGNERDNRRLVRRIVNLRLEIARLLGFDNYAEMVLGDRMAETHAKVQTFMDELFTASHPAALRDMRNVESFARENGHRGYIERWDWAYFSEKLKKAKYDFDDEVLKPYFRLDSVESAVFDLANRLYGLSFIPVTGIQVYHPEVKTWEVSDKDGSVLAIFYADYHPREGKNSGAWMTTFRDQRKDGKDNIIPLVSIVTNFTRPTNTKPSLITLTELTTFLHEFGHALHAILSNCTYESISGTNVARDFVELPSQIMENWAYEQEWLDSWAIHYETNEKIPPALLTKIRESSTFNEGYACDRQLGFGFLDMAWHTIEKPFRKDISEFESEAVKRTDIFPKVETSSISCSFTHLFGGGYAAGYYGYKWSEVLDADAFSLFSESGIFNRDVASSFRRNILEMGASDKPMNLYKKFRGKEPSIDAFLERSGLK